MSLQSAASGGGFRRVLQSIAAVMAGLLVVVVLSTAIDAVFHALHVYPPEGEKMPQPELNLLALSYRIVVTILGGYIAAWIAPAAKMRHALVLGVIGTAIAVLGCIVMIPMDYGPAWYPIALAVTALPCCWLGARLRVGAVKG